MEYMRGLDSFLCRFNYTGPDIILANKPCIREIGGLSERVKRVWGDLGSMEAI